MQWGIGIGIITAFGQLWLRIFSSSKMHVCRLPQRFSGFVWLTISDLWGLKNNLLVVELFILALLSWNRYLHTWFWAKMQQLKNSKTNKLFAFAISAFHSAKASWYSFCGSQKTSVVFWVTEIGEKPVWQRTATTPIFGRYCPSPLQVAKTQNWLFFSTPNWRIC